METIDRLKITLSGPMAKRLAAFEDKLTEIRMRAGGRVQLVFPDGEEFLPDILPAARLSELLAMLMDYSVYARESELRRGFFTLRDGSRVGVCGRMADLGNGQVRMAGIGSICVRVARAVPGCADALADRVIDGDGVRSALIVSPPGMGKTTMLRDLARQISLRGWCVGIADERHELAACYNGVPTLDVGPRTDVVDGAPKRIAIPLLVRSMAPRVIVTDELGDWRDAETLADAARCGVSIVASAHGRSIPMLAERKPMGDILRLGVFQYAALLSGAPGQLSEVRVIGGEGRGRDWKFA